MSLCKVPRTAAPFPWGCTGGEGSAVCFPSFLPGSSSSKQPLPASLQVVGSLACLPPFPLVVPRAAHFQQSLLLGHLGAPGRGCRSFGSPGRSLQPLPEARTHTLVGSKDGWTLAGL